MSLTRRSLKKSILRESVLADFMSMKILFIADVQLGIGMTDPNSDVIEGTPLGRSECILCYFLPVFS